MLRLPSYEGFVAISERGRWDPEGLSFEQDAERWPGLPGPAREQLEGLLRGFLVGEHAVADEIEPFAAAASTPELAAALEAQRAEEVRHRRIFERIHAELIGIAPDRALAEAPIYLAAEFIELFGGELPATAAALRGGQGDLGEAVGLYHGILEGAVFLAGQDQLLELARPLALTGLEEAVTRVQKDERWHVSFGMRMLHDLGCSLTEAELIAAGERALDSWGELVSVDIKRRAVAALRRRIRTCGIARSETATAI